MVELSFDVIAAATQQASIKNETCLAAYSEDDFILASPSQDAATVAEWKQFISEVTQASCSIRALQSDLPEPFPGNELLPPWGYADEITLCQNNTKNVVSIPGDWRGPTLGDVKESLATGYGYSKGQCNIKLDADTTNSFFNSTYGGAGKGESAERTGNILGYWAASIDNHDQDLSTEIALKNEIVISTINEVVSYGYSMIWNALDGVEGALECAWDWLTGGDCDESLGGWWKKVENSAQEAEEVLRAAESFATFHEGPSHDFIGVWHHINVTPFDLTNYDPQGLISDVHFGNYDDYRGFHMDHSGPNGSADAFEIGAMIVADAIGKSVDPYQSAGIQQYQIANGQDGHPNTKMRGNADFEIETIPHIEFEPVDNLAKYGWDQFKSNGGNHSSYLAWPLHAIGDATVPQHTVGSVGWGHRPFEDAMDHIWPTLSYQRYDNAPTAEHDNQVAQAHRLLVSAFRWNKWIKQQQQARGISDLPIRDLVTAVALKTNDSSMNLSSQNEGEWPFNSTASLFYAGGSVDVANDLIPGLENNKENSIKFYSSYVSPGGVPAADMYRPILEEGIGATIAFLVATGRDHASTANACHPVAASQVKSVSGCL
ncbi:MAG: hypothetical protein U0165_09200 [Polyangiaceae bacterium]